MRHSDKTSVCDGASPELDRDSRLEVEVMEAGSGPELWKQMGSSEYESAMRVGFHGFCSRIGKISD